jgi:tetratricopeptide (TPR) repeat protein
VSTALLVEYFNQLPERRVGKNAEEGRSHQGSKAEAFKKRVAERYTEGTLLRLLSSHDTRTRRAAVLALALLGGPEANAALAARLHDDDAEVCQEAVSALWTLWFRGGKPEENDELQRLTRMRDRDKAMTGLDQLIQKAPHFAEAYNQRAILLFRAKLYERCIADCERTLQLNPHHFGAQAGLGQCLLQLRKHKAALKAFRLALRINPHLDGIAETVRALENALGEEGRDKK